MQSGGATARASVALKPDELSKLTGNATIENYGWIKADIYNGNDFDVGFIVVSVTVHAADGKLVLSRDYRLSSTRGESLQNNEYIGDLGFRLDPGQTFTWLIKSANRR